MKNFIKTILEMPVIEPGAAESCESAKNHLPKILIASSEEYEWVPIKQKKRTQYIKKSVKNLTQP